jgi:hypothetical protein
MKNAVFRDVMSCGSCKYRRFREPYRLITLLRSVLQLLVTANVIPISLILYVLMMKTIRSFETPVLTRAT